MQATNTRQSREFSDALVVSFMDAGKENVSLVGGIIAGLGKMVRPVVPVTPGFVVTAQAYQVFMEQNRLYAVVNGLLSTVDINDAADLRRAAWQIQQIIVTSPLPEPVESSVLTSYRRMGGGPVTVRSSTTAWHLPQAPFAGPQKTFLRTNGLKNLLHAVRACWASPFEHKAILCRSSDAAGHEDISVIVAVQPMGCRLPELLMK